MRSRILIYLGLAAVAFFLIASSFIFLENNRAFYILPHESALFRGELTKLLPTSLAPSNDLPPQPKLENPPAVIKALYATSWSVSSTKKLADLIRIIDATELNAIVIDVKDYTGIVAYNSTLEITHRYKAVEPRIARLNTIIKKLHDAGIYVIARIAVFQDQKLPIARPDLALIASSTGSIWKDSKGILWLDTSSKEVWDYNIAIANEVLERGVDEINFDYIRFASDGPLADIAYPLWDGKTLKTHVVRDFFAYARSQMPGAKISADLFGLVTVNKDGLGIGQHLEFALPYFDAIAPMVYPSHYYTGFIGIKNPAAEPYKVIRYSMDSAITRVTEYEKSLAKIASTTVEEIRSREPIGKLRPWIQDFNLGATYGPNEVRAQIQAFYDSARESGREDLMGGWMLWSPSNRYTEAALLPE